MNFPYQPAITIDPITGDGLIIGRPEVFITVHGSVEKRTYRALVDTGADRSVFPKSLAADLAIKLTPALGKGGVTFSGESLEFLAAIVTLELTDNYESVRWPAAVLFHDFGTDADESIVLGHAGFLEYFTAVFDGQAGELTLTANDDLPLLLTT